MKHLRNVKNWQWLLYGLLFLVGLVCLIGATSNSGTPSARLLSGIFAALFMAAPALLLYRVYSSAKQKSAAQAAAAQAYMDERNAPQYQYQAAQALPNHTVVEYTSSAYADQVWLHSLRLGDEIHVTTDYNKGVYLLDGEALMPPRLVNIYQRKRICRLYVHDITEQNEQRSIKIFCVYNPE